MNDKFHVYSFSDETRDIKGEEKPLKYLGRQFVHSGNGHTYTVVGITWIGDIDEWGLVFLRPDVNVYFTRSMSNFRGFREGGQKRFERVL